MNQTNYSYPNAGTRRTLSNATTSTASTNGGRKHSAGASTLQRTTSSRSGSSPTSYVALMRKQKATVWSDRAQFEDPRLVAQQRAAKMRAAMEVNSNPHSSSRVSTSGNSSITGGMRAKIRHHGAPKAQQYNPAPTAASGVPMRLSAREVDDEDSEDDHLTAQRIHHRSSSGRSSFGSAGRASSVYGLGQAGIGTRGSSEGNTPPQTRGPATPSAEAQTKARHRTETQGSEPTPVPDDFRGSDYFSPRASSKNETPGSTNSAQENEFGKVGGLPHRIENTEAKVILVEPSLLDTALVAAEQARFPKERIFLFDDQACSSRSGVCDWSTMLGSVEESENWWWRSLSHEEACNKTAVVNFSSGTTGLPKGVMISHRNIISNVAQSLFMRNLQSASPQDSHHSMPLLPHAPERWLGFLPLYHAFGQLWSLAAAAFAHVPTYMMRAFALPAFLRNVERHRITHIQTAPPVVVMLAKRPEAARHDLSSLSNILCGAAPLSAEVQNEVMARVGGALRVVQTWGMTEVTCSGLHVPGLLHDQSGAAGLCDPNSCLKLVDDQGSEVQNDETRGEIFYKGPNVCLGYWRNEQATQDTFDPDGFLKTGDVAVRKTDASGRAWYWIVDRKKELIKVRGFQVAPAELEVADAAVVGLRPTAQNDEVEERPKAYVVMKEESKGRRSEQDIVDEVARTVSRHKWLTGGVKFVDEVPKSPSGKIQRVILKQWAESDVKAESQSRAKL
ncbi:MAG: hypothetical protein Q9162_004357 [Coniocarpon cinnabarinum]